MWYYRCVPPHQTWEYFYTFSLEKILTQSLEKQNSHQNSHFDGPFCPFFPPKHNIVRKGCSPLFSPNDHETPFGLVEILGNGGKKTLLGLCHIV
jgi:hypothetical protein